MNLESLIRLLRCPSCRSEKLTPSLFSGEGTTDGTGIVRCDDCGAVYPIEDGTLEILSPELRYEADWKRFAVRWRAELGTPEFAEEPDCTAVAPASGSQAHGQQKHFDWYAENPVQSYSEYERSPFWRAADRIAFGPWKEELRQRASSGPIRVLDVGCAQGRSTFHLADLPVEVVGFDVSKSCVRKASERARLADPAADLTFLCADAAGFPFRDASFDVVLVYGVLHHVESPASVCREIGRVLRPGGIYFGQENNVTVFRWIFDLIQRLRPAWYEEAGPESVISGRRLGEWLRDAGMSVSTRTSVFLPPHLVNLLTERRAHEWLRATDIFAQRIPGLRTNGGVVVFRAEKLPLPGSS